MYNATIDDVCQQMDLSFNFAKCDGLVEFLSSRKVYGGPSTSLCSWSTQKFPLALAKKSSSSEFS